MAKIFLIEDSTSHIDEIMFELNKAGHEVSWVAQDSYGAIKNMKTFTQENKPDLIVTDNSFPRFLGHEKFDESLSQIFKKLYEGGVELSKFIRSGEFPLIKDTPIVMYSFTPPDLDYAKNIGINKVANKFNKWGLSSVVNKTLKEHAEKALKEKEEAEQKRLKQIKKHINGAFVPAVKQEFGIEKLSGETMKAMGQWVDAKLNNLESISALEEELKNFLLKYKDSDKSKVDAFLGRIFNELKENAENFVLHSGQEAVLGNKEKFRN